MYANLNLARMACSLRDTSPCAAQVAPHRRNLRSLSGNLAPESAGCCLAPGLFDAVAALLKATQVIQPVHMLHMVSCAFCNPWACCVGSSPVALC
jgi:hypothetical protein